jgi:hypothetical protein
MVVIGRLRDLTDDERRGLVHWNHNAKVKVITYDDLLARIDQVLDAM